MADRDELILADMANDPNILRLTVRPEGVAAPPITDVGEGQPWGAPADTGRPSGRLFEPDQTPVRPTIGERIGINPIEGWPSLVEGAQTLGRGIGGLVQGAGAHLNGLFSQASPRAAPDPTAAARQMWQQNYPSPQQPSLLQRGVTEGLDQIERLGESQQIQFSPGATPEQRAQAREQGPGQAADVGMNIAGFGMTGASVRGGSSLGVFGGRIEPGRKAYAERLEQQGMTPDQIWKEVGVVRFADKQWRQEIPDIAASYRGDVDSIASRIFDQKYPEQAGQYRKSQIDLRSQIAKQDAALKIQQGNLLLPDVIPHHPQLYTLYPELRHMPVSHDAHMQASGGYLARHKNTPEGKIIYREEPEASGKVTPRGLTFRTLIHEIDHAIANIEGFAKGSNSLAANTLIPGHPAQKFFEKMAARVPNATPQELRQMRERAGHAAYNASAGEKSALVAEHRVDFTPEQLAAINPTSMMRPRIDKQIVEFNAPFDPAQQQAQMGGVLSPTPREMQMSVRSKPDPLYSPSGLATDRQTAGYSNIKGGTPVSGMNWRMQTGQPLETRTSMPIDKALRPGDEVIPIVGDDTRKLNQGYVTEIGGQPVTPVLQQGGFDFGLSQPVDPRTGLRDIWGNAQGAATQIDNMARAAEARGNRPVIMSTTMGKTGADFSHQLYNPTIELLKRNPPNEELAKVLDTFMRTKNSAGAAYTPEQFPGFASPEVWKVLDSAGGAMRAKVMKALDRKTVVDAGGPDIGLIRVSQANPDLYNTPAGHMGYHIANVAPGQTGPAAHTVYPIATRGSDVRGLGGSVPGELMLPDLAKGLEEMYRRTGSKEYLGRMDYYAIRPPNEAAIELGMKPLPKTQVVTKQMIDAIGEYVHKHGLKSLPPAVATLYLANSGGEAKAAPMGGVVDPSRYNVQ